MTALLTPWSLLALLIPAARAVFRRDWRWTKGLDRMADPVTVLRRMRPGQRIRDLRAVCVRAAVRVLDALTAPLRMRRATGQHAAELGLAFDANRGQWRHAETGPMAVPAGYGADLKSAAKLVAP